MFKFLFKTPSKKEDASDLEIEVELEEDTEPKKSNEEMFNEAVEEVVARKIHRKVAEQLERAVLGDDVYEQSRAALFEEDEESIKEKYPKARLYNFGYGTYKYSTDIDSTDIYRYFAKEIVDKMKQEGKL